MNKGEMMNIVYSAGELRNIDSAIPIAYWDGKDKSIQVDPAIHVMNYNKPYHGVLQNMEVIAKERGIELYPKEKPKLNKVQFKDWLCEVDLGFYSNKRIAISLIGAEGTEYYGEPIATATVNIPEENQLDGFTFIKEWSENDGMTEALIKAEILKPNFTLIPVGTHRCFASVCELNFKHNKF